MDFGAARRRDAMGTRIGSTLKRGMCGVFGCVAVLATSGWPADLGSAWQLYQRTEYKAALQALEAERVQSVRALLLKGQIFYRLGQYEAASEQFEQASQLEPGRAEVFLWLGRSVGRQAEASSFFTALGYARRCREALERSVALDGTSVQAMRDLLAYYLEAPGFLGGGIEKAEKLAERIAALDATEGHDVQARIAEKRRDFSRAEAHLRRAVAMAPRQIDRQIELAEFLARRGQLGQSEQILAKAAAVVPESPKLVFAQAEMYIRQERNLEEARALLWRYLQMPLTPEDPPRWEAERLLAKAGG